MSGRWVLALACVVWGHARGQGGAAAPPQETLESMVDAHMEALDRRAAAFWQQGLPGEAVKLYEEMASYRPRHADSHFNVGIAYYAMGEHAACMQALDRALRLPSGVPHHSMYHQQLAASDLNTGALPLPQRGKSHSSQRLSSGGLPEPAVVASPFL